MGGQVLYEGDAWRESFVLSGFVNLRFWRLQQSGKIGAAPTLHCYKLRSDESPTKSWTVNKHTTLSAIGVKSFKARGASSLAVTVARGTYKVVALHFFSLSFGGSLLPWGQSELTLCFERAEDAEDWHSQLAKVMHAAQSLATPVRHMPLGPVIDSSAPHAVCPENGSADVSGPSTPPAGPPAAHSAHPGESSSRSWQSVWHVNGVAVYKELDDDSRGGGGGGGFMVATIIRAPPEESFNALVAGQGDGHAPSGALLPTEALAVLESIDSFTQVVQQRWTAASGVMRWACAPRDMVVLRTWRREPDGTYIVLFQSTTHRRARASPGRRWLPSWRPVRSQVDAAGFTISPLLPSYVPGGGGSQESLVTLVVKADLGGNLGTNSLLSRLAPSVAAAAQWALLEPILMSVVLLRDRVEQSRFVVRPYSMAERPDDGAEGPPSRGNSFKGRGRHLAVQAALQQQQQQQPGMVSLQYAEGSKGVSSSVAGSSDGLALAGGAAVASTLRIAVATDAEEEDGFVDALSNVGSEPSTPTSAAGEAAGEPGVAAPPAYAALVIPEGDSWAVGGTTDRRFWSFPGTCSLRIRGSSYLEDRVKIPAAAPMFDLWSSDLVNSDEPLWHLARSLPSVKYCPAGFVFVLTLIYPVGGTLQSLVSTWSSPLDPGAHDVDTLVQRWGGDDEHGTVRAFFHNLKTWMEGDGPEADRRRSTKFKLIPRVPQGSWVVRQSVGTTPVLLGQKLQTKYFRGRAPGGAGYFEVDVDLTSNTVANSVTRLVVNAITSLVVDLAPLVEGQTRAELPERLIGAIRYDHLDLSTASYLDEDTGGVSRRKAG